ncbi:signal recognition particle-docking protein FtsY [Halobacteria archaeon AArc-dxtr1]|nr:signal recognition particle-docking protein FtsY [Halobacteria archaeon AArc-dxtr1]
MFDNLKEKLGSFRSDATEAAEENVEPVADDEDAPVADEADADDVPAEETAYQGSADADAAVESPDEATDDDGTSDSSTDVSSGADETPASAAASEASTPAPTDGSATTEPDSTVDTADDEPATAEPVDDADDSDETDDADEADSGTSFGRKAKSLVRGKFVIEEEDLEGPLQELELALLSADVELGVAEEITDSIRDELVGETRTFTTSTGDVVEEALKDAILEVISVGQFDFDERIAVEDKPVVIIFTGVNGVGKTTSIAKLDRYFEERGYSTVMANGDTYRAGANEQIREHAEARDSKLIAHEQGGDPAAVLYDAVEYAEANDIDVVLGDTAGRLHTDEGLMDQLEKIGRVVGPDMTLFVDEAVAGQDAVNRAREFNEAAEIDGAILTKADADSNGGAAISIAHVTGKPILFLGVGQEYPDIERFDPDEMVDRLLEDE